MYRREFDRFTIDGPIILPELKKYADKWNSTIDSIEDMPNLIIHGPDGVGKYHFALSLIQKFSPSKLKIYKKTIIESKITYMMPVSDIHFEIDFAMMAINTKTIFLDIMKAITDINPKGIILCRNLHLVNDEFLDVLYYLMPRSMKWVLLSAHMDFIPNEIVEICNHVGLRRPLKTFYLQMREQMTGIENGSNARLEHTDIPNIRLAVGKPPKLTVDYVVGELYKYCVDIEAVKALNIVEVREILYHILTYHLSVEDVMARLYEKLDLTDEQTGEICRLNVVIMTQYRNNYRPIYHLERWFYRLIYIIYKYVW
jgi:DNA polymerase III delta prime subunit